jgi:hypothetical protein
MDDFSSLSPPSTATSTSSTKSTNGQDKKKDHIDDLITINEKVNLTKQQHQVLKIVCDTYEMSLSEYMQQALVEAMRFDLEEGNFSDALLGKLGDDGKKKDSSPSGTSSSPAPLAPGLTKNDLDLIKKLQTEV